jgi:hypothetical protein
LQRRAAEVPANVFEVVDVRFKGLGADVAGGPIPFPPIEEIRQCDLGRVDVLAILARLDEPPLALDEELGEPGIVAKREGLEASLAVVKAEVARLGHAHRQAVERDEAAANAAEMRAMRRQFADFEEIAAARLAAAEELDRGCEMAARGWAKLLAANDLLKISLPGGTHFPRGAIVGLGMEKLASGSLYRHAPISGPGDQRLAFPGSQPATFKEQFDPQSIRPCAEVIGEENGWYVQSIKGQIDLRARFHRGQLDDEVAA